MKAEAAERPDWREIIYRGVESEVLDYKAAMNWNTLTRAGKGKLVRHALALANTRGGDIVIGVGEDASGHPSVYTGLTEAQASSFDPSSVITFINRHVEPPIDVVLERPLVDGKRYAVLHVRPFSQLPHVCSGGIENEVQTAVFYIRTPEAASRAACRASELHALIQRALRNQREMLGKMLRGLLYETRLVPGTSSGERLAAAARDAETYFLHRRRGNPGELLLALRFAPESALPDPLELSELRQALRRAAEQTGALPEEELRNAYFTNTAWRSLPEGKSRMWQLERGGMFLYFAFVPVPEQELSGDEFRRRFTAFLKMLGLTYTELGLEAELLDLELRLSGVEGVRLVRPGAHGARTGVCRIPEIRIQLSRSGADWLIAPEVHAERVLKLLEERFNLPEDPA